MRRACALLACLFLTVSSAISGGPLVVTGPVATQQGHSYTWDPAAMPIPYVLDGGPLSRNSSGTTIRDNATGAALLGSASGTWQSVSTAAVSFSQTGTTSIGDGDIDTLPEYAAAVQACDDATQNPIIFDADGSLLRDLGGDPFIIGFAGPCALDPVAGRIRSALLLLNGQFVDGFSSFSQSNPEISIDEFEETAVHELGHFLGLDHSQVNAAVLNSQSNCTPDNLAGLPIMFPFLTCSAKNSAGLPILAPDDTAWISKLYPSATFAASYGTIRGFVIFSDGLSQFQGANVIAQRVNDPGTPADESKRIAVSAVSGLFFTGNPGQSVSGNNTGGSPFGSRDAAVIGYYEIPVPPGAYTILVEPIRPTFAGGSSVGPMDPPIAEGFGSEYWNQTESKFDDQSQRDSISVVAGQTVSDINIILNGSPSRFDQNEDGIVALPSRLSTLLMLAAAFWKDRRLGI